MPDVKQTDHPLSYDLAPLLWREGRRHLLQALAAGRSISFCWAVYQQVIAAWQRRRGIMFVELVDCDREAMTAHLIGLE